MNPKRIIQLAREFLYFKKIIKTYSESLADGKYKIFNNMRSFALDTPETIQTASKYFIDDKDSSKIASIISKLNRTNFYTNKNSCDCPKFEAVYSANNYDKKREIKLFSFKRKEILTICTSADSMNKQFYEYERFHSDFGMPRIAEYDKYDNSYIISMVDILPRLSEKAALENITHCIASYHISHPDEAGNKAISEITNFSYDSEEMNNILQKIADRISPDFHLQNIPMCMQHGDLSRSNQIYGTCDGATNFWWIDWEWAGSRIFLYDYFFYILNTALYYKDPDALYSYLGGDFDEDLAAFFGKFGLEYSPAHRMDYFLIFALDFLKERVCDRGNLTALKMYWDFLEKTIFNKE